MRSVLPVFLLFAGCGAPLPSDEPAGKNPGVAAVPADPTAGLSGIPAPFQGTFDRDAQACGVPSIHRLEVSARALQFHESLAAVRQVKRADSETIDVTADFQGEGESWSASQRLKLGVHGATLTLTGNGVEIVRVRCPSPGPPAAAGWETGDSGEGDSLWLRTASGRAVTLFCPSASRELIVNVAHFRPVGSEERLSFGAGGTVVALVADPAGDPVRGGVSARGPVPDELTAILSSSAGIAVNYGAQNEGPHPPPPADLTAAFAAGCRD